MELFENRHSTPVWIDFENHTGEKGRGGMNNGGAKGQADTVPPKGTLTLCDCSGEGVIRRIWITIDERTPEMLRGTIIRMYWDGSDIPAVEAPLGDFFCMSLGSTYAFDSELISSPEGRSFCCFIPMPFRTRARITAENTTDRRIVCFFFDVDLTLEKLPEDTMYFHAESRVEPRNPLGSDVTVLDVKGGGRLLGVSAGVVADTDAYGAIWWGEGEMKLWLDGDEKYPSLCGTGSEDYLGTAWGQGCFCNRTQGCLECGNGRATWYRWHTPDPIFFRESCRVALQTIGGGFGRDVRAAIQRGAEALPVSMVTGTDYIPIAGEHGTLPDVGSDDAWVNFYRRDSYRTTAYYYLTTK